MDGLGFLLFQQLSDFQELNDNELKVKNYLSPNTHKKILRLKDIYIAK